VRILIVAATRPEVAPLIAALERPADTDRMIRGTAGPHEVDLLLTGVGMVATAVWCSRALTSDSYDAALNLGICGSFSSALPPPTVVNIVRDSCPELGAEDGSRFLSMEELGFAEPDAFPYSAGRIESTPPALPGLAELPAVTGITVNTVHGDETSIASVVARVAPDIESMEGAAFLYACRVANVPCAQVRAVSNRVERRNRAAWDIGGAIRELGVCTRRLLELP
jgi:futalosine hydrolase